MVFSKKVVGVVGCGAAGLATARELRKEGHIVVVFERGTQLGGTWAYTPETDSDLVGLDPTRKIVSSSAYNSLRTNVPRELMGFRGFPFLPTGKPNRDSRRHPGHTEVLRYLEDFANAFNLKKLIRFETEVVFVGLERNGKWNVKSRNKNNVEFDETFDAVVICTGHYTQPSVPQIPGIEDWPGWQCHSHNYRTTDPYQDKVVVVVGGSISAIDISEDLAKVAKEVHVACRSEQGRNFVKKLDFDNVFVHHMARKAYKDGKIAFQDGTEVIADAILYCTGYKYEYPYLHTGGVVTADDNRVGPLYKHIFPPTLAPGLSFVGIPNLAIPFPIVELQGAWIAGILSGRLSLPSEEKMMEEVEALYSEMEASKKPKKYTHNLGDDFCEFAYEDVLAKECGMPLVEEWRKGVCNDSYISLKSRPSKHRDEDDRNVELYRKANQQLVGQFLISNL